METNLDPKEMHFFIRASLDCGIAVTIMQRSIGVPWELILAPKPGTVIGDSARIVDGELKINMHETSALGFYQLLTLIIGPPRRKKFLGVF